MRIQGSKCDKIVGLFCGAGGFFLGAHSARFHTTHAIDINKKLTSSFKQNFPNATLLQADISKIGAAEITANVALKRGELAGVIGAPPCQGLLQRMTINGGLHHCIGKEVSRFEQGKGDFIENIDDVCIHYDGGRVAANETLIAEISERGLRRTTKETGLDRKTIRVILKGKKVKASTLAKVVIGMRKE
jgi:C-5 cytosine-specific DNA methylase